jgi:hypothetical protein
MENVTQPNCFADWDATDASCKGCAITKDCERATGRQKNGTPPPQEPPEQQGQETVEEPEVNPLDYLLDSLGGKYDRQDRIGDKATGYYFEEDSRTKVLVTVSKESGRVRVQAKGYERIFDSIESVEAAEEILGAIPA